MKENLHLEKENMTSLLEKLQKGDRKTFSKLYLLYHKALYLFALRYLNNEMLAEDVIQNVFVKLWESKADLSINVSIKNYLYTMTRNLVLNEIRNNNTAMSHYYQLAQTLSELNDGAGDHDEQERIIKLYEAIGFLPTQKRKICLLKIKGYLSNQDIAERMGISINTVKSHYSESLKILKLYLKEALLILLFVLY